MDVSLPRPMFRAFNNINAYPKCPNEKIHETKINNFKFRGSFFIQTLKDPVFSGGFLLFGIFSFKNKGLIHNSNRE